MYPRSEGALKRTRLPCLATFRSRRLTASGSRPANLRVEPGSGTGVVVVRGFDGGRFDVGGVLSSEALKENRRLPTLTL